MIKVPVGYMVVYDQGPCGLYGEVPVGYMVVYDEDPCDYL